MSDAEARKQSTRDAAFSVIVLALLFLLIMAAGCTSATTEYMDKDGRVIKRVQDARCVVQNHTVVLGLDIQIFDFLATGNSSPSKIRLGYVTSDTTVTPFGMSSEFSKVYKNVLWGENEYTTTGKAFMQIGDQE